LSDGFCSGGGSVNFEANQVRLQSPGDRDVIRSLRVGDRVLLSGFIVTGRDLVHRMLARDLPDSVRPLLRNAFIYHCGPVAVRDGAGWRIVSAGPTTSMREEPYQAGILKEYGLLGVIGKGGMGRATSIALAETGGVYLHATGGAGSLLASRIVGVPDVRYLAEFGVPEAMWVFQVSDFPATVTMDSTGSSLHESVLELSRERLAALVGP